MPYRETSLHPHVSSERADTFTAENGATIEDQYRYLILSLIACLQPHTFLEIGGGASTLLFHQALPRQCDHYLVESNPAFNHLGPFDIPPVHESYPSLSALLSSTFASSLRFSLVILDDDLSTRASTLRTLLPYLTPASVIFVHDTSLVRTLPSGEPDPATATFYNEFDKVRKDFDVIDLPLSRGALLLQPRS